MAVPAGDLRQCLGLTDVPLEPHRRLPRGSLHWTIDHENRPPDLSSLADHNHHDFANSSHEFLTVAH